MKEYAFTGQYLDRASGLRNDEEFLVQSLEDTRTRFVLFFKGKALVVGGDSSKPQLLTSLELRALGEPEYMPVFLGMDDGAALFAVDLSEPMARQFGDDDFLELWRNADRFSARHGAILAYGKAMLEWHRRHRFCGRTGAPNQITRGGHQLVGGDGQSQFPRVDPAIIVLVHRDDRCLLGRQPSWPAAHYSTIAGFVEPGESLEDAVAREVFEETNVRVGSVHYQGSQPWPFPTSLMVGFHASADSSDIALNDGELDDARWFSRQELETGDVRLPPPVSISFHLIERWFDAGPGDRTLRDIVAARRSW